MKEKTILWISNHEPSKIQIEVIEKKLGCKLSKSDWKKIPEKEFDHARWVVKEFQTGKFDEVFFNGPLSVFKSLADQGIHAWRVINKTVPATEKWDFEYNGRYYQQVDVKKVKDIQPRLVSVKPDLRVKKILRVSVNPMKEFEERELKELFGEGVGIVQYSKKAPVKVIFEYFEKHGFDEMLMITPMATMEQMLKQRRKPERHQWYQQKKFEPLYSKMEEIDPTPDADLTFYTRGQKRCFKFMGIFRLTGFKEEYLL